MTPASQRLAGAPNSGATEPGATESAARESRRPGSGPLGITKLLRQVRELEITARRNASSLFSGNYLTAFRGRGLEFHEARKYTAGEPIRHIDWRMTARLREPYVRTYLEERQREVFLAIDTSPSMFTGWQARTKLETAIEAAATIGFGATRQGDRLGFLTFAEGVDQVVPPSLGKTQLFVLLRALLHKLGEGPKPTIGSDPRAAIHAIQKVRGRRFVVFVLSDFMDHDVPDDLRFLQPKHDVSLVHIWDRFEHAKHSGVRLPMRSPEGEPEHRSHRLRDAPDWRDQSDRLRAAAAGLGVSYHPLSTEEPVGPSLARFFHRKQARLSR